VRSSRRTGTHAALPAGMPGTLLRVLNVLPRFRPPLNTLQHMRPCFVCLSGGVVRALRWFSGQAGEPLWTCMTCTRAGTRVGWRRSARPGCA